MTWQWAKKCQTQQEFKERKMKYRFDHCDVVHASRNWFCNLDMLAQSETDIKRVIDEHDVQYIRDVMSANPKLERLMPYIIQETLFNYEEF